jgi:hypothetical protein
MCAEEVPLSETMLQTLKLRIEAISGVAVTLLKEYSNMHPVNKPGDFGVVLSAYGSHYWKDLSVEGKRIQVELLPKVDHVADLIDVLAKNLPASEKKCLKQAFTEIRRAVDQSGKTWSKSPVEAAVGFRTQVDKVLKTLDDFFGSTINGSIAIPDTNALLMHPDIETWKFVDVGQFVVVLTPAVLSELDAHKISHKNEDVRKKAEKIIRKIKEYRRRGTLAHGVPVVKGKIELKSIAREPDIAQSLPWLDANNTDDRFLASTIEIIRDHLSAECFIATYDINMQNKAEFAGIPYRELAEAQNSSPN